MQGESPVSFHTTCDFNSPLLLFSQLLCACEAPVEPSEELLHAAGGQTQFAYCSLWGLFAFPAPTCSRQAGP